MDSKFTYKDIYQNVVTEIDKRLGFSTDVGYDSQLSRTETFSAASGERKLTSSQVIQDLLSNAVPGIITDGLNVTATNPISSNVNISKGSGSIAGRIYNLKDDTLLPIPLIDGSSVYYILLYQTNLIVSKTILKYYLPIAKIVVPNPGTTILIQDKRAIIEEEKWNAYIVNLREYKLYGDANGNLEEDSLDLLKNAMGTIFADNIFGTITLSENLKITNIAGTLNLDSSSMRFYDSNGDELAYFGATLARVGNIHIQPHSIQSGNYTANLAGFIIQDDGNAEFNNVRLRGTLYTSIISENIYIGEGISFIGDLNFEGDVGVTADHKILFDGIDGDTFWRYNSSTQYLEGYVNGNKRIEL